MEKTIKKLAKFKEVKEKNIKTKEQELNSLVLERENIAAKIEEVKKQYSNDLDEKYLVDIENLLIEQSKLDEKIKATDQILTMIKESITKIDYPDIVNELEDYLIKSDLDKKLRAFINKYYELERLSQEFKEEFDGINVQLRRISGNYIDIIKPEQYESMEKVAEKFKTDLNTSLKEIHQNDFRESYMDIYRAIYHFYAMRNVNGSI